MRKKLNYFMNLTEFGGIFRQVVILCVCLFGIPALFAGISVQADDKLPQGTWGVVEVTVKQKRARKVERNTDGNVVRNVYDTASPVEEENVYDTASKVKSFIPCPQEWEIRDAQTIKLRYPDGNEDVALYSLNGDQFTIAVAGALFLYRYSMTDESLTLTASLELDYNQPEGGVEHISESCIIILKKK